MWCFLSILFFVLFFQSDFAMSWKLGEKVINNCTAKLKPYLVEAVKSMGVSSDEYAPLLLPCVMVHLMLPTLWLILPNMWCVSIYSLVHCYSYLLNIDLLNSDPLLFCILWVFLVGNLDVNFWNASMTHLMNVHNKYIWLNLPSW